MQTATRCYALQRCRTLVLALMVLLIVLPARAQDQVTIEEKQSLSDLAFGTDVALGNFQFFAAGDALVRYLLNDSAQAVSPATIPYDGVPVALAATDELLFVGNLAPTLTIFDITDPNNIVQRGTAATLEATLDIEARGDLVFTTPDILVPTNAVEIFDVSDPDNPDRLSQYDPGAFAADLFIADSGTELLIATEEKLEIVDISDPDNPALLGSMDLAGRGAKVTMIGPIAFVGSQQPEDPQTQATPGWFLEAFDVSDPSNPQLLGATGGDDGPIHALIRLGEAYLLASTPEGLVVFSFEAASGAFKRMMQNEFSVSGVQPGNSPNAMTATTSAIFTELPDDLFIVFTNACTELPNPSYGLTGIAAPGNLSRLTVAPRGTPMLTTTLTPGDAAFCLPDSGQAFPVARGQISANDVSDWNVSQLTFSVATNRLNKEDLIEPQVQLIVGGQPFTASGFVPQATGRLQQLEFATPGLMLTAGETKAMEMVFALDYQSFGDLGGRAVCSTIKEIIDIQLSINGQTQVAAEPVPDVAVKELLPPNPTFSARQSKRLGCVLNVTDLPEYPDKPVAFPTIQLGEDDADEDEEVGVCPGTYIENVAIDTKGLRLFSMFSPGQVSGPDTTQIRSPGTGSDVVRIDADQVRLEGFFIHGGNQGVVITSGSEAVTVGADVPAQRVAGKSPLDEEPCAACNVISGNTEHGVLIQGADARILGNFIGTTLAGDDLFANGKNGITVEGDRAQIGSAANGGNVISGNSQFGIALLNNTTGARILGNFIGLNAVGDAPLGNRRGGVFGEQVHNMIIGGTLDQDGQVVVKGNVISGNGDEEEDAFALENNGVHINNGTTIHIVDNLIGLDATGADTLGNAKHGIEINNSRDVIIGGAKGTDRTLVLAGNVVSGNQSTGILIGSDLVLVYGNTIGFDKARQKNLPNRFNGIRVEFCTNVSIGGPAAGQGNIIATHNLRGIRLLSAETLPLRSITIEGNTIGTDPDVVVPSISVKKGITLSGGSQVHIKNNRIQGWQDDSGFSQGIAMKDADGVFVTGNEIVKNGEGIQVAQSSNISIEQNQIEESDNNTIFVDAHGINADGVTTLSIQRNTIKGSEVGVKVVNSTVSIVNNTFKDNTTCARILGNTTGTGVAEGFLSGFFGNTLDDCTNASTGLRLTGVTGFEVRGNQFINNAGAAVMIDSTSSDITLSRNNFISNPDFGVQNLTPSLVTAQDNFWGSPDGPSGEGTGSGDAVSTGVDFSNFRTERVSVVIAAPDTAAVVIATPDTVDVFVRNFADLSGTLSVTATDELGWLAEASTTSVTFEVALTDSLGGVVDLAALAPEGTSEGTPNRVTIEAVSTADSTQFDSVTLVLVAGDPTTNVAIEADPEAEVELPEGFRLTAAYPNPFNPQAQFTLTLGASQRVEVAVYDVLGRRVAVLYEGMLVAGQAHRFVLDGGSWPSGVYYYQIIGEHLRATQSVILLK